MTTFPRDIRPGTVIKVTSAPGCTTTYTATDYAAAGSRCVKAKSRNPNMPSGWELADIMLFPSDTIELI